MGSKLKRDCRIKWGSLVTSIKSALDIKPVLKEFLKYSTFALNDEEWDLLDEIYSVLMPVKDVVDVICRADADLLQAEIVFIELFDVLESIGTPLSRKMLANLKTELEKRWQTDLVGLLKYLNDPSELDKVPKTKKLSTGNY